MSDARRNSVDIPLSKTLVALKRVRSLRDPATNSLGKYATTAENMIWETHSSNGAVLELSKSANYNLNEEIGNHEHIMELDHSSRAHNPRNTSYRKPSMVKIRGLNATRTKLVHRVRQDRPRKSLDSNYGRQFVSPVEEEVNSSKNPAFESPERTNGTFVRKPVYGNCRKTSAAMSRVGSPCMSIDEARTTGSRRSALGLGTEDTRVKSNGVVGSNFSGCGLSSCWSGTPKYHVSNPYSDSDCQEQPLLSAEGTETAFAKAASPYQETPRSLSQKFRPRSFNELVGLNVVAQSLLYAICKGKVAPMYLFHGPRGTGKTSTARIFAAALNCASPEEHRPCGLCKECMFQFSGRSRDVKELDAAKIDRMERVRALLKSASLVPYSSRFKVFIIDECQILREEAWSAILKSIDELSRHVVYIMITSDLEEVPRSPLSHCQKYHFPKIKVADIVYRLQRICIDEGLEFDNDGLHFVATKSNGSLRDAETMLDQLGLLGKRITISLAHELIGSVSDDELIELLDLALSSDTANTVRKARELMGTRVDPLQLVSQLANLIMDILAGRCQSGLSEVGKNFFGRHAYEWASRKNMDSAVCYACNHNKSNCTERHCRRLKLENIWRKAVNKCQTKPLRSFLRKEGSLLSLHVTEDLAIAEVGFSHPDHLSSAEQLQNQIASSLQHVLGCNVEMRLKLVPALLRKDARGKRQSFSLLSCSGRKQELSDSAMTDGDETERSSKREPSFKFYSSNSAKPINDPNFFHDKQAVTVENDSPEGKGEGIECIGVQEPELQPSCLAKTLKLQRRFFSADVAHMICLRMQPHNKMDLSITKKSAFETYFCPYDPYNQGFRSDSQFTCSSREDTLSSKDSRFSSKFLCWKAPKPSI
ncbi:Protein STICHEL-like 2 [Ananas comosus]|uniref:DNA-directed DNA polymerase n=1 Tax=Ananas comosus TaxID=4615 RepID=A0A199V479_ANACO|nr:Protein STICHEL-like 2 [Ananas comosus]